jgi:ankyrin repeat protein
VLSTLAIDSGARAASTSATEEIVMELDLDQARRRAKELLRAARAGDPDALARMRGDRPPRLADAQRAVAGDLGFPSWPALVDHVEAARGDREERRRRLVAAALDGRDDVAERLLAHDPALARAGLDVALVLGDERAVAAALDRDPELVSRELPGVGRKPLSCACHSAFLRPSSPRAPAVRRVVELLLDRGADVDEVHHNEYGAMSVLYGAAGVAHDLETTRLLLDRGADPDDGESVYHAVEAPDTACLELLLDRGATVRDTNALGNAIAMGDPAKVRVLLEKGDLRPSDPELRGALLRVGDPEIVRLLIDHGAALDARDSHGRTPYMRSARMRDPATMRLLEQAGASTELDPAAEWLGAVIRGDDEHAARVRAEHPDIVLTDDDREDLPRWASAGADEVVARLLDAGVPLDARGVDAGTALHYAGMWGRASTVELLLARGAEVDVLGGPREHPGTPLAWTAWGSRMLRGAADRLDGYVGATAALLAAGARVTEGMIEVAADEVAVLLEETAERDGVVRDTGRSYLPGRPIRVSVRRRGIRYEIDDMGTAVAIAGRPPGWREAAERVVAAHGWNVTRAGSVSVAAVEGRDIDALVARTGEVSAEVLEALLALED